MLINYIRDTYRDISARLEPTEPIVTVPVRRPAANSGNLAHSDMQARRHRRQRRMERAGFRNTNGWTVRAW